MRAIARRLARAEEPLRPAANTEHLRRPSARLTDTSFRRSGSAITPFKRDLAATVETLGNCHNDIISLPLAYRSGGSGVSGWPSQGK